MEENKEKKQNVRVRVRPSFCLHLEEGNKAIFEGEIISVDPDAIKGQEYKVEFIDSKEYLQAIGEYEEPVEEKKKESVTESEEAIEEDSKEEPEEVDSEENEEEEEVDEDESEEADEVEEEPKKKAKRTPAKKRNLAKRR